MSTSIPVTVVTGPLGSGKTTLLNRLLCAGASQARASGERASKAAALLVGVAEGAASRAGTFGAARGRHHAGIVVVECEAGAVPFDHGRVISVQGNTALVTSACPCCAVQGEMVDALRDLFLQALHRKIPPLSHVLIETAGTADPAAAMYTLKYDRFLGERFAYRGCVTVLDAQAGSEPLHHAQGQQQAALADLVIISKTDGAAPQQIDGLRAAVQAINPDVACLPANDVQDLAELLEAGTFRARTRVAGPKPGLWSGRKMAPQAAPGLPDMAVLTLAWQTPLRRSDFARVVDRLQSPHGPAMVRVRGRVWFQGADAPSLVNGVHQQLHVVDDPEPADDPELADVSRHVEGLPATTYARSDERRSELTLVYRGAENAGFRDELRALAPGGEVIMSSSRNFVHGSIAL